MGSRNRLEKHGIEAVGAVKVLEVVRARAATLVGLLPDHVEPPQLVRYCLGQRYLPHMDWSNTDDVSLWVAGQRVATVLVYLRGVPPGFRGGATRFPQLGSSRDG